MAHSAREEMLSRIKAALKTEAPRKASSVPTAQTSRAVGERREDLIEQFEAELTRIGGHLFRAESVEAASEYVEQLARAAGARRVIGWDSPLIDKIARVDALEKIGVEFLRDRAGEGAHEFIKKAIASDIGITTVDYALAETGTLVLISGAGRARSASLVPPIHVGVVEARQIISGLDDLFRLLAETGNGSDRDLASAITFITGPSRTADIEMTLVVGVHGPQQLHVILLT
jgi:L-lactate dehydrogenase complex protein LldG